MNNTRLLFTIAITGAAFCASAPAKAAIIGPTSELYFESSNTSTLYAVQGNHFVGTPVGSYCNHCESAIAVDGDIRSLADAASYTDPATGVRSGQGGQYSLGLKTTTTRYDGFTGLNFSDGATDGLHNFVVGDNPTTGTAQVYQFDRNWSHAKGLFDVSSLNVVGITYDPLSNSFYISSDIFPNSDNPGGHGVIQQYSLGGQLLGSFNTMAYVGSLALDYADRTLWTLPGAGPEFDQYSLSGKLLQKVSYAGLAGKLSSVGLEFDLGGRSYGSPAPKAVPEPDALALVGVGLAGACTLRRRRRGIDSVGVRVS